MATPRPFRLALPGSALVSLWVQASLHPVTSSDSLNCLVCFSTPLHPGGCVAPTNKGQRRTERNTKQTQRCAARVWMKGSASTPRGAEISSLQLSTNPPPVPRTKKNKPTCKQQEGAKKKKKQKQERQNKHFQPHRAPTHSTHTLRCADGAAKDRQACKRKPDKFKWFPSSVAI